MANRVTANKKLYGKRKMKMEEREKKVILQKDSVV